VSIRVAPAVVVRTTRVVGVAWRAPPVMMSIWAPPITVVPRAVGADPYPDITDADPNSLSARGCGNAEHGRRRQSGSQFSHDVFPPVLGPSQDTMFASCFRLVVAAQ